MPALHSCPVYREKVELESCDVIVKDYGDFTVVGFNGPTDIDETGIVYTASDWEEGLSLASGMMFIGRIWVYKADGGMSLYELGGRKGLVNMSEIGCYEVEAPNLEELFDNWAKEVI